MTDDQSKMPLVSEDWQKALAVVAHPDDLEYGMAAAIARWTKQGKSIAYLLITSGEAGIDSLAPVVSAVVRQGEQQRSAAVVGVESVEFMSYPDGTVVQSLELRRDIAAAIRRHKPDVLIGMNYHDTFPGGFLNHADHRAVGKALIDAVRDAANRWVFPGAGGEPWSGVQFAIFGGSPHATNAIDVTDTIDDGIASLREHSQYLEALSEGTFGKDPEPFLRGMAEMSGEAAGLPLAVTVELIAL